MSRSIFGWDLPPGVTSRMIDEAAGCIECPGCHTWFDSDEEEAAQRHIDSCRYLVGDDDELDLARDRMDQRRYEEKES